MLYLSHNIGCDVRVNKKGKNGLRREKITQKLLGTVNVFFCLTESHKKLKIIIKLFGMTGKVCIERTQWTVKYNNNSKWSNFQTNINGRSHVACTRVSLGCAFLLISFLIWYNFFRVMFLFFPLRLLAASTETVYTNGHYYNNRPRREVQALFYYYYFAFNIPRRALVQKSFIRFIFSISFPPQKHFSYLYLDSYTAQSRYWQHIHIYVGT